jgi:hypothetical protein
MHRTRTKRRARESPAREVEEFRLDRWAWAQAIINGVTTFALEGIYEGRGGTRCAVDSVESLGKALTYSEDYMDAFAETEREYRVSSDCDDEWKVFCKEKAEDDELDEEELAALIADKDKRRDWAYDQFDPQWAWDQIKEECEEIWFIHGLLKKYPVIAVRPNFDFSFILLEEILGYCPGCNFPILQDDVVEADGNLHQAKPHRYKNQCQKCPANITCGWDSHGEPRTYAQCESCSEYIFFKDDCDGPWLARFDRPFNWPPGAPYPPRLDFAGGPDGPPPWQED